MMLVQKHYIFFVCVIFADFDTPSKYMYIF